VSFRPPRQEFLEVEKMDSDYFLMWDELVLATPHISRGDKND